MGLSHQPDSHDGYRVKGKFGGSYLPLIVDRIFEI